MIERVTGNLLEADVEALVNTVNTVGVMGKGIALQFKKAFPEVFKAYKRACDAGEVTPGRMFIHDLGGLSRPRYIIHFPTKRHWRGRSKIEDICSGLAALAADIARLGIRSIAVPPLGCGHGGLNWAEVYPLIEAALGPLPDVQILVYEPAGTPAPERMPDRTERPNMTPGRAAVLGLMRRYQYPGSDYLLSLLEIHKLAYFAQTAGVPLNLEFKKGPYGPYADAIRHVLHRIEGHFVQGFGDGRNKPGTPIRLLPDAADEAEAFLAERRELHQPFERVARLIEGFETPYGLELLSSVHWVATQELEQRASLDVVVTKVHGWNPRKRRLMRAEHIRTALDRLRDESWVE